MIIIIVIQNFELFIRGPRSKPTVVDFQLFVENYIINFKQISRDIHFTYILGSLHKRNSFSKIYKN